MALSLTAALLLATHCAPDVAPQTLLSMALVESGFDPLAIGINGPSHRQLHPAVRDTAVDLATRLIRSGVSIDLGLAQINSRNLPRLGLSVSDAFDPCRNLAGAARVLMEGFTPVASGDAAAQSALRIALSRYNTGDAQRGFRNGYVAKVVGAARTLAPPFAEAPVALDEHPAPDAPQPPAWKVFAAPPPASFVLSPQIVDGATP